MNTQQQEIYMLLLMAGRKNEALAFRDQCYAGEPSRNDDLSTSKVCDTNEADCK